MIQVLDDITWQAILHSDQNLNHFVEEVAADLKHLNNPRKNPETKNWNSNIVNARILACNVHVMHTIRFQHILQAIMITTETRWPRH